MAAAKYLKLETRQFIWHLDGFTSVNFDNEL